ncbi:serine hydrolase domain-containing protein [Kineococcus rubinsiae]|uniref:serine hydrolase domain-containing protein n=1 Tax=Kineococcus rubinsiae TaxID=2609562 RepID=UPI001AD8CCDB|nr:serine hydrolase domain-containing protein [Kineococcus rubinsiae]NIZ92718.1 beta-lactamase family protein [Kineococcus rubinsiae]
MSLVVRTLAAGYEEVGDVLAGHLAADPSWGCQLVVRTDEGLVVDLASDSEADDPLHVVASVTKGVAGVTVALALQTAGVDPGERVAALWPEFAAEGKSAVTIAQLLSHQVGLLATTRDFTVREWGEDGAVAADLAAQRPLWAPGRVHGYHALTVGPLADELVRRLTGLPLWRFYEEQVRAPLEADFWVRLPDAQSARLREVVVPPSGPAGTPDGA